MTEHSPLKILLIDDEERARNSLSALLTAHCTNVTVVATASNVPEGVLAINKHKPDLVFLDIEMPEYNGFELLDFFREIDFEIIFATAYSEYAIRAFEVSAIDYLLKPIQADALQNAVEKARQKKSSLAMQQRMEVLKAAFREEEIKKIALPMSDGLLFAEVADIVLLEADGAYTTLTLKSGSRILVSKKLKFFEDLLGARPNFFRPHRSFLINVNHLQKYTRADNSLLMDNGAQVVVSREKKSEFEELLRELRISLH